jgi:hypothetical protein
MSTPDEMAVARLWPEPTPLPGGLPRVPEFREVLLPEGLQPWVIDIAERMQCPPDFPAAAAVVTLAAVVGRQIAICPKRSDDWTVVPNLWGAIVGRPGLLKTPATAEPMRMVSRLETAARDEHLVALREHEASAMVAKAAVKQTERAIAAALKRGDQAEANRLALESVDAGDPEPVRRRYVTSDATVEKLGDLLAENPRGILLYRDELVGWLSSLDREGREGTRQFFLEAWNGDGRFTFDRIGRGTVEVEAACVSIFGGIQPGPLADYLRRAAKGGMCDDGLVQRLQVLVWPDAPAEFRNVDRWPDSPARERAWQTYQRLDALYAPSYGATDTGGIPVIRFAGEAQEMFDGWREGLERRLRGDELTAAAESHLAKYRSLVPSLALLFHLADADAGPVTQSSLARALAWATYLEAHALRVYSDVNTPEVVGARELLTRIRRGDLNATFTARDVYRPQWRGLDRESTRGALAVLEDHDYLKSERIETGGHPRVEYHVNPRVRK